MKLNQLLDTGTASRNSFLFRNQIPFRPMAMVEQNQPMLRKTLNTNNYYCHPIKPVHSRK